MKSRCPVCHKIVGTPGKERAKDTGFFPFCSEQCKLVDLGAWLDANYRITCGQQPEESKEPSDTTSLSSDSR
ncbi:MAG: DNA gyrase inhibitor YacG [Phycisphaerales bacterium]|nr:MAG: DNA gyrase inhibitor YacG [Phycisphaerales bacterium]